MSGTFHGRLHVPVTPARYNGPRRVSGAARGASPARSGWAARVMARGGVGHAAGAGGLEIAPQQFDRIEVRRIGRKPYDMTARMSGEPLLNKIMLVGAAAVPHQDESTRPCGTRPLPAPR